VLGWACVTLAVSNALTDGYIQDSQDSECKDRHFKHDKFLDSGCYIKDFTITKVLIKIFVLLKPKITLRDGIFDNHQPIISGMIY
jgi:hypothetical protein